MFCVSSMHSLKGRCFFLCICKKSSFRIPFYVTVRSCISLSSTIWPFLERFIWTPSFCSFINWADYGFVSLKFQDNLCMETAGKQNFVWKKLSKTENGWHSGERRPKATSMWLRFLSVRTRIHCKRTSLALPSLVNSMCDLYAVCVLNGYYWKIPMLWITVILYISIFARYKLEIVGGMGPTVGMVSRLAIIWSWFTSKQSQRNSESIQHWLSTRLIWFLPNFYNGTRTSAV